MRERVGLFIRVLFSFENYPLEFLVRLGYLQILFPIPIKKSMNQNSARKSPGFALVVGLGIGLLIALIKKKIAFGLLIGIVVAAIIYKRDKR